MYKIIIPFLKPSSIPRVTCARGCLFYTPAPVPPTLDSLEVCRESSRESVAPLAPVRHYGAKLPVLIVTCGAGG